MGQGCVLTRGPLFHLPEGPLETGSRQLSTAKQKLLLLKHQAAPTLDLYRASFTQSLVKRGSRVVANQEHPTTR